MALYISSFLLVVHFDNCKLCAGSYNSSRLEYSNQDTNFFFGQKDTKLSYVYRTYIIFAYTDLTYVTNRLMHICMFGVSTTQSW